MSKTPENDVDGPIDGPSTSLRDRDSPLIYGEKVSLPPEGFERSEAPSGACREGGAMRRPGGTRRNVVEPACPWGQPRSGGGKREAALESAASLTKRETPANAGVDAVSEGFEPPEPCSSLVFKTNAIDHSANSPYLCVQRYTNSFARQNQSSLLAKNFHWNRIR